MFRPKEVIDFQGDFQRLIQKIRQPTLIINREIARQNIRRMAQKARLSGVRFRPHFKTHQSADIGEWFREVGVRAITVSSVEMASYFAQHGWDDITIAFPVNWREIEAIERLAGKIRLHLLVESTESVDFLAARLTNEVTLWIKIDVGYHRTGIAWDDVQAVIAVAERIESHRQFKLGGFLTHFGNTYGASSVKEIDAIYRLGVARLQDLAQKVNPGTGRIELSVGDTPSCSRVTDFREVDEIRPGNFVFYDLMQYRIGSCTWEDIACVLACPVVAKHDRRKEIVIYGGAVHLSKDYVMNSDGAKNYGSVVLPQSHGWGSEAPHTFVKAISQEHGIVTTGESFFSSVNVGDVLLVVPVHSCLSADLMSQYFII